MDDQLSVQRLYGGVIAVVSGGYAILVSSSIGAQSGMTLSTWLMVLIGLVVLIHGVVLFTPLTGRLSGFSGPSMIAYAILLLVMQVWLSAAHADETTGDAMMNGNAPMTGTMLWDPGMLALALLLLVSGVIMVSGR